MVESVYMGMGSAFLLLVMSSAMLWIGKASAQGDLPRNNAIGIRTRWTLVSDEAWRAGHDAGGRSVKIGGIGSVVGAALAFLSGFLIFLGVSENFTNSLVVGFVLASAGWVVCWLLAAAKAANRAARAVSA